MNKDFDVFGDITDGIDRGENHIIPQIKQDYMNPLQADNIVNAIIKLCKRAITCVEMAKKTPRNNIAHFSWSVYLLEKAIQHIRELANEYENEIDKTENIMIKSAITVNITEKHIEFDFPVLMPKRQPNLRSNYYSETLENLLQSMDIPEQYKSGNVVVTFLHCYKYSHANWAKKDHDNIEVKWIIDALNNNFFIDDGPFRTSLYHHSTIDLEDHTRIFLVPYCYFVDFLGTYIPLWEKEKVRYQKDYKMY